jgi:TIR domain/Pentapeptide repeats (8 copies)
MANPEHLAILRQGVKAWNASREKDLGTIPDLSEANLAKADLSGADLRGANLTRADLFLANLIRVNLEGADLTGARLWYTIFVGVDLSRVRGLDTLEHRGPSEIGVGTIYKSGGKIPEAFLRSAGVPENFITYVCSLVAQPKALEFYSAFISYSSKDDEFARRLHADLQARGVRVWFAPEDLKIGDKFRTRIDEAIRIYDKVMLVLSANSINSAWVESEVEAAFEKERQQHRPVLLPIRLDNAVMEVSPQPAWVAEIYRTWHIGDFTKRGNPNDYQMAFQRLLHDLKANSSSRLAPFG